MASLSFRVDLARGERFGPGKRQLLQLIGDLGSISAAGRAMKMSYRRAWLLVEEINASFSQPLVEKAPGGAGGGGAILTPVGRSVLRCLDEIDDAVSRAAAPALAQLDDLSQGEGGRKKKAGAKGTGRTG
ncbi:MAG TPA: LysR family transcriptional regulator [Terriglobia bacterium]|nr:LysR family transcriptional regulator [Terriglobia bacterium]